MQEGFRGSIFYGSRKSVFGMLELERRSSQMQSWGGGGIHQSTPDFSSCPRTVLGGHLEPKGSERGKRSVSLVSFTLSGFLSRRLGNPRRFVPSSSGETRDPSCARREREEGVSAFLEGTQKSFHPHDNPVRLVKVSQSPEMRLESWTFAFSRRQGLHLFPGDSAMNLLVRGKQSR